MKTQIYLVDDLVEIELDVEYDATYQSAKVYGPAEDCYPDSSEMNITDVFPLDELPPSVSMELFKEACEAAENRLQEEAWEDFMISNESDAEDRADYYRDAREDR